MGDTKAENGLDGMKFSAVPNRRDRRKKLPNVSPSINGEIRSRFSLVCRPLNRKFEAITGLPNRYSTETIRSVALKEFLNTLIK